jgi:hypothetical protein
MYKLPLLFSLLITITINAKTETSTEFSNSSLEFITLKINQFELEDNLFSDLQDVTLNIEDIEVFELEEDVEITFDTTEHLPENFNELVGKNDIDWSEVELVVLEEDVEIAFDTTEYLPKNFNALSGKNDIDWSKVELFELEEEIELGLDTKDYLPKNFNPYRGMDFKHEVVVCLN